MKNFDEIKRTFSNHRRWRDFIATIHESMTFPGTLTYPNVIGGLRERTLGARNANTRCNAFRVEIPPMSVRTSLQD
jgi:hypothetical protein